MIYKFKFVSDEKENFSRTIEIDSMSNFLEFRNAILESVDFSKEEMSSFFMCDDKWNPAQEITLIDMGTSSDEDSFVMDSTRINEFVDERGQKLLFMFDFVSQRCFFIELLEMFPGKSLKTPKITESVGIPPKEQLNLDELDAKIDKLIGTKTTEGDLDAEFFGDSEFDIDELDNGFDDFNF